MKLPAPDAPICTSGHRPFRTREEALKALRGARHLRTTGQTGARPDCTEEGVFECKGCTWFHLTSSARPRRRSYLGNRGRGRR